MFARQVRVRLKTDSVTEFAKVVATEVMPLLAKQAGFLDHLTLVSPDCAEATVITFWDTMRSERTFNRGHHPEVSRSLLRVIEGQPSVNLFEVISSTFYPPTAGG